MQQGGGTETQVTWEDQQNINRFGRLKNHLHDHELQDEIKLAKKTEVVNEELWNEAGTYGDIQLMAFVDYYSLILWMTIAICIYGVFHHESLFQCFRRDLLLCIRCSCLVANNSLILDRDLFPDSEATYYSPLGSRCMAKRKNQFPVHLKTEDWVSRTWRADANACLCYL
ncbi:unnamed protein product [Urochloa humidicola]